MRGSLDTSALLRYITQDIPESAAAVEALLEKSDEVVVANTAFVECVFVLTRQYHRDRSNVQSALYVIMGIPSVTCNRPLITTALDDFVAHPSLSFEDCLLAAEARLAEAAPLYTFDKKLARQLNGVQLVALN